MHTRTVRLAAAGTILALLLGGLLLETSLAQRHHGASGANANAAAANAATAQQQPDARTRAAALARDCRTAADGIAKQLDGDFHVIVEPPFVVAGNMTPQVLRQHALGSVVNPAKAMWKSYFTRRPQKPIVILLFTDARTRPYDRDRGRGFVYRHWAKKLFNDVDVAYYGYYRSDGNMLMNIDTGGGTLVHELTHALIAADFPEVPDWFNEGLGSLHEQCNVGDDEVVGLPNWRLPDLQMAIAHRALRPLRELITRDDFRSQRPVVIGRDDSGRKVSVSAEGLNYAHARYFVMYMQQKRALKAFYAYYRDHHRGRDAAVKAVERVFRKKLAAVEKDFLRWVVTLRYE